MSRHHLSSILHRLTSVHMVASVRRLFLVINLFAAAILAPTLITGAGEAGPVEFRIASLVLLGLIAWRWVSWIRRGTPRYLDLALEGVTIGVASVAIGDPMPTLGIVYASFYFRPVVGHMRWAVVGAVISLAGLFAGARLAGHEAHSAMSPELIGQIPTFAVMTAVGCLLAYILQRHDLLALDLRTTEQRYRSLVEWLPEVVYTVSLDGVITYISPQVAVIVGRPPEEVMGTYFRDLLQDIHEEDRQRVEEVGRAAQQSGTPYRVDMRLLVPSRGIVWIRASAHLVERADGLEPHWLGTLTDITAQKVLERQLTYQAFHDHLTDLPNRALFRDRLERAAARIERNAGLLALLFLDLDNFKVINDSLGHERGDDLLREIADRLKQIVRDSDTVARLGGDEFIVLLEGIESEREALTIADRIHEQLQQGILLAGQVIHTNASIGIVVERWSDAGADELIRRADLAMYAAKRRGKARTAIFQQEMNDDAIRRLTIETELRQALNRDELVVHYQPVIDLETGQVIEVEALVRWQHPERGMLSPGVFLPVAEETGMIRHIDNWVLREACSQVRHWQRSLPPHAGLVASVNLSPSHLQEETLVEEIESILTETGLRPEHLKVEITEHAVVIDIQNARDTLARLSQLGVRLAIDDFGTGNSALNYLRQFPIDTLKIDRSFITGLDNGGGDVELVKALITLAGSLGLDVTAEGIEGDEYVALRSFGCSFGQGYGFAHPLKAADAEDFLTRAQIDYWAPPMLALAAG